MTDCRVAIVRCVDYEFARVEAAVRQSIDLLGGMGAFVSPGQRVLLKPNLLRALGPEKATTTHPTVVASVAKMVIEAGGHPIIADSPGGPYSPALLRFLYRKTEMAWAAQVSGAELNESTGSAQVPYPEGHILRRLDLIQPFLDADVVINLPKLKTHNLSTLTLGVKNLFGLVPGTLKIGYHAKLRDTEQFCRGMVDIATHVQPVLNLVDGVIGMEGNGPSGGDPRPIGVLIASPDVFVTDVATAALVGLDPLIVPTVRIAAERGLCSGHLQEIEFRGECLDALRLSDFRLGTAMAIDPGLLPRALTKLITMADPEKESGNGDKPRSPFQALAYGWFSRQLVVAPQAGPKCSACGYCVRHCPVNAITIPNGRAHMDHRLCIRCYCCHELCPELAVELTRPWLGRVLLGK